MPNWCSTTYIIESENKELLQKICNAINECATMKTPLVQKSAVNWAGNVFKMLGIDPDLADRTFWSSAEMKDGKLEFFEEGAWSRGDSIIALDDHFTNEDGDSELSIIFISEELGSGIYETNDEDGIYFDEKYIFVTDDDLNYYKTFGELKDAVQEYLGMGTDFKSVEEMRKVLDSSEMDENLCADIYELGYADLRS